jgi:peptidylprolyl isomerase
VARSRQRERELARRRYERRRLREQQLRARRRRRNTVLGASLGTAAVIVLLVLLGLHLFGGSSTPTKLTAAATPPATAAATPTPVTPGAPCKPIAPNPPQKGQPTIPPVVGPPPTSLKVKDVKVGSGPAAKAGSDVSVTYIGVGCSTGKVFDASYLHGDTPFDVKPLGSAGVITGWNQGLIGVKAGGVRELVIPPALGYGASGSGSIPPNETLIFLITVKAVK